ncbi:DUF3980 domain-containing protein [Bacillus thuringiensis]|nr:DUF3980 domain-containing protein [Bacillus thuringiensis]
MIALKHRQILKIMSVIYLIGSILMDFSAESLIHNPGFGEMSFSGLGAVVGVIILGSIFQSVLVCTVIWVFILLVETVIKIYKKMK